jgi:hypothetical protein
MTRRQYATASVPDRFAKIQTLLDCAFQLLNLLVQARCHLLIPLPGLGFLKDAIPSSDEYFYVSPNP